MGGGDEDAGDDRSMAAARPPPGRRLADRLLTAFHAACDQGELDAAAQVLRVLEALLRRQAGADPNRRRGIEGLVAAHERLWQLRHPGDERR